jgi:hypothetical protein
MDLGERTSDWITPIASRKSSGLTLDQVMVRRKFINRAVFVGNGETAFQTVTVDC